MDQEELWNSLYKKLPGRPPQHDKWLDKYQEILTNSKDIPIIDLGCGTGYNTFYLIEHGYQVIPCDFSIEALKIIKRKLPEIEVKRFNFLDGLPFNNGSARIIIADLTLHYFYKSDTMKILEDISRVLVDGGHLLCRINSVKDFNHGADRGEYIEDYYYNVDGKYKRFFNRDQIEEIFREWKTEYLQEYRIYRFKKEKVLWEIALKKIQIGKGVK